MAFPATHLSVIQRIASDDAELRAQALERMAKVYWEPICTYITLTHRAERDVAEDLTQGFFAEILRRDLFAQYDPSRARFRTFVRTCADAYVANEWKAGRTLKRGGGVEFVATDVADIEGALASTDEADARFHDDWVRGVFATSLDALRQKYASSGREKHFELFERYDVAGVDAEVRPTYADIARDLGISVSQATNWLHSARRDFRAMVLGTLRDLTGNDEEYREEVRALLGVRV